MTKNRQKNSWKGYLNYSLTSSQKKDILQNVLSIEILLHWLEAMAYAGYAVSISQTKDGNGVKLTITGRESGGPMDGYSVTSWGAGLWQCLSELHYLFNSGIYGESLEGLIPMEGGDDWFNP